LDVKPPFSSYIEKVYVKIGDRVKQGDPLVTFSPSLGRGETNFPVRSAFSGVVTQVLKNEGEHVLDSGDQNNIVVRVEDLSQLYVMVVAPELDIAKLKVGQEATIRISSLVGETFSGKISEISMSAKDRERWGSSSAEFQLKVQLNEHDARLFPGMSALLDIVTDRANHVLTLPHEYIQEKNGAFFVTAASGQTKNIVLGLRSEEGAEIKSGLTEGDRVQVIDFLKLPKIEN
jgi:HlyD family secretion protein